MAVVSAHVKGFFRKLLFLLILFIGLGSFESYEHPPAMVGGWRGWWSLGPFVVAFLHEDGHLSFAW